MAEPNTNQENPDDGGTEVEETEPIPNSGQPD